MTVPERMKSVAISMPGIQGPVLSVNRKIGHVVLGKADVALDRADNTADHEKPVSSAQQAALDQKLDASQYHKYFKGSYASIEALQVTWPTGMAIAGDYATVDQGAGFPLVRYSYDEDDGWVLGTGIIAATTAEIVEGGNLYFTEARVRSAFLSGLSTVFNAAITAADSVLSAIGKLQAQITFNAVPDVTFLQLLALNVSSYAGRKFRVTDVGVNGSYWCSNGNVWRSTNAAGIELSQSQLRAGYICFGGAGSYSQSGTVITVVSQGHGLPRTLNGARVYLAASGSLASGWHDGFSWIDQNSFSVRSNVSQNVSGALASLPASVVASGVAFMPDLSQAMPAGLFSGLRIDSECIAKAGVSATKSCAISHNAGVLFSNSLTGKSCSIRGVSAHAIANDGVLGGIVSIPPTQAIGVQSTSAEGYIELMPGGSFDLSFSMSANAGWVAARISITLHPA